MKQVLTDLRQLADALATTNPVFKSYPLFSYGAICFHK